MAISLGGKIIVNSFQHTVRLFLNLAETAAILTVCFPGGGREENVDVFSPAVFSPFYTFSVFFLAAVLLLPSLINGGYTM